MNDCCAPAYGKVFGERGAQRAANRYRKKGLDKDARWIVEVLRERGLQDARVLELGGGVGALHLELLRHGAASAANVELSPEWELEARELLREHGLETRVERRVGDAVHEAEALESADIVVMHRVVCCYPDADRLMAVAAARARRFLAVSFPRDRPIARLVVAAETVDAPTSNRVPQLHPPGADDRSSSDPQWPPATPQSNRHDLADCRLRRRIGRALDSRLCEATTAGALSAA